MSTTLTLQINGKPQTLDGLTSPTPLPQVIAALALKHPHVAVEHNGEIIPRSKWDQAQVSTGDHLEIVHFVGGGSLSRSFHGPPTSHSGKQTPNPILIRPRDPAHL